MSVQFEYRIQQEPPRFAGWFADPDGKLRRREERRAVWAYACRHVWWAIPASALAFSLLTAMIDGPQPKLTHALISVGILALLAARVLAVMVSARVGAEGESGRALLEDPSERNAWPVEITIVQEGVVTGRDQGVAWFEDRAFGFSGGATSFLLTDKDLITWHRTEGSGWLAPPLGPNYRLLLWTHLRPYGRSEGMELRVRHLRISGLSRSEFEDGMRRMSQPGTLQVEPPRSLRGQLPPLEIGPGAPSPSSLAWSGRLRYLTSIAVVGGGISLAIFLMSRDIVWAGSLVLLSLARFFPLSKSLLEAEKRFHDAHVLRMMRARDQGQEIARLGAVASPAGRKP